MKLFRPENSTRMTPAQLLARDEALLDSCDSTDHPGFLTFWESTSYFVVLGYSKDAESEVFTDECKRRNSPILRRCSGGGTVLQGPGCLNYTLILPFESASELETITGANRYIMQKICAALAPLARGRIEVHGHTDLTVDGLKFSGNAQRRKRRSLLFHGSFLLRFDLPLVTHTLRLPSLQPEYRANRPHELFLANLPLDPQKIEAALIAAWHANGVVQSAVERAISESTQQLVHSKYSRDDWNLRS